MASEEVFSISRNQRAPSIPCVMGLMMSHERYFNVSAEALLGALLGPFQHGMGMQSSSMDAIIFRRNNASAPTEAKARWILEEINRKHLTPTPIELSREQVRSYFRMDNFDQAEGSLVAA